MRDLIFKKELVVLLPLLLYRQPAACRMKMLWSYALLLLVLGVMLVIWTAGSYHTFVCTSLVKVSVAEVQGRLEDDLAEGHVAMSKATRHSDGEPSRGFSTNVSELSTVYRHSFRTNTPLEDHQLVLNSPYFRPRLRVVTPLVTKYLIEPEELCKGPEGSPLLLIFIPSIVTNVNMRRAIRAGWGRAAKGEWPGTRHLPPVKILFVFGRSGDVDEHAILWQEKEVWGDVLFADFTDTYRNLTVKVLTSLHFAATRCPTTDFVLKVGKYTKAVIVVVWNFGIGNGSRESHKSILWYIKEEETNSMLDARETELSCLEFVQMFFQNLPMLECL